MSVSKIATATLTPIVVFGALYALAVRPQRASALQAQHRLEQATAERDRARVQKSMGGDMAARAKVIEDFLKSPAIGGVRDLSIQSVPPGLTVTFNAGHGPIGRFLWRLPAAFDVESVELIPGPDGLIHASIGLLTRDDPPFATRTGGATAPQWTRNPLTESGSPPPMNTARRRETIARQTDPIVSGILESEGRRVAVVDGRIVGPGDLLGTSTVQSIEPEAVVIAGPDGRSRRLPLRRPAAAPAGPM